jgi:uncharacterized protein YuzE
MPQSKKNISFELSVSGREDGTLEAVYIRFRDGKVASTKEVIADSLIVDYDLDGNVLGMEILAPVPLKELSKFVEQSRRSNFKRFISRSAPAELVLR